MIQLTAHELRRLQETGQANAESIARAFLDAVRRHDGQVKAFLHLDEDEVLRQAKAIDAKRAAKQPLGPLAGIPVAIKDVLCVQGQPATCGSKILQNFRPPYDATVVAKLREADAVLFGSTNMDEFAMGSSTENSAYQTTRNPWNLDCVPGGSSGGSAAAVAACEVPLSLGTDTGGSVRQPASLCGIVGMKPTYGRVSRYGLIAYGSSLDQVGPFARDVGDVALLLESIAGHDPRDSTSGPRPSVAYSQTVDQPLKPLTIGVAKEYFAEGLDPEVEKAVRTAIDVYKSLGATIKDVTLPHSRFAVATYYLVATAEASSNLARYDGVHFGHRAADYRGLRDMHCKSRGEGFGTEVKRRIMLGAYALSSGYVDAYYLKALKVRRLIKNDFDQAFADCDVILGPTSPTPAFRVGEKSADPLAMYLSDIYTISANLAGIPGISVPCGFSSSGLPLGLQLLAAPYEEEKLLRVARMYEQATEWRRRRPPLVAKDA
ncbi:MAG: Asp-tRNA(Asn)/Glu-tRNA(Gln) amidotransferase subunit GatA [Gemmataceae bacterium]|nr:Asp-tRNA(Asn)/Glu-tRNA(Gln) amidotransferase subunit GatA [Gemmataceae bacterium]